MKTFPRSISFILAAVIFPIGLPPGHAAEFKIGGTGAGLGIMRLLANAYEDNHPDTSIEELPSLGSSGGIKAVAAGAIQLSVSSRKLKAKEQEQGLTAREFARTPFVFAVSTDNTTNNITLAQVVDIYAGKSKQWPDGSRIRIVLRPLGDADSKMVGSMSPAMAEAEGKAQSRQGVMFAVTDQDAQDSLERIPGAIGPTSLGQMLAEQRRLKALILDGVRPSPENLANGSYPYAKILFLVTGPSTPPVAQDFVAFIHSEQGREILNRSGYWIP